MAVLARRRLEPDLLLHARRPHLGAGARAAALGRPAAALLEVRRRREAPHPRHLHRGPREPLQEQPLLPALRELRLVRGRRRAAGKPAQCAAAHLAARPHLQVHRGDGQRVATRHRADRRRQAAHRLHPPGRQPRHLLLRVPQRQPVGQPQDRRRRPRLPLLHLRRGHAGPRGSAHRLPVAPDRRLPPGGGLGDPRRGPYLDVAAAHCGSRPLLHPPGDTAWARRPEPGPLLRGDHQTRGFTDYLTRIHAIRAVPPV